MLFRAAGDRAVLIELGEVSPAELRRAADAARRLVAVMAVIEGHSSLLLILTAPPSGELITTFRTELQQPDNGLQPAGGRTHQLRVAINSQTAPDLADLLAHSGLSFERFMLEMESLRLTARHLGFIPGFAYLEALPPSWRLPRRPTSRRVAIGSLGFAGANAGFYPSESPGGWNIVGRTDAVLWDAHRTPPNWIAAGDQVCFRFVDELRPASFSAPSRPEREPLLEVVHPGQAAIVVSAQPDFSRVQFGLPAGGAFDADLAAALNLELGLRAGAGVLEVALVGPELRFLRPSTASWAGAETVIRRNGTRVDPVRIELLAGDTLAIGPLRDGARGWLAVLGGLEACESEFTWRPAPLRKGETIGMAGDGSGSSQRHGVGSRMQRGDRQTIAIALGPHPVSPSTRRELLSATWVVAEASDRSGVRLRAKSSSGGGPSTLPSCGMLPGSVQWHPNGELVVMGPDHPVTGGYLQPMTVLTRELWKLAQLRRGDSMRFASSE